FDSIGVDMPMFAMAVLGWNAAAGLAVALSRGRIPLRNGLPVRMPWRRGGPAGAGDDDAADDLDGGSADTAEPDGDGAGDGPDDGGVPDEAGADESGTDEAGAEHKAPDRAAGGDDDPAR